MIKKVIVVLLVLFMFPSTYALSENPSKSIEINLDQYDSKEDKYFYKIWSIDDKKIPTFGEFRIRFNSNIYYKDIESIVLIDRDQQIPVEAKINNATADIQILTPLRPNYSYKLVIYQYSKYKYSININTENYGDIEPNNTAIESNLFNPGDRINGSIQKDNPDYYSFVVDKPTEILFDLERKDGDKISLTPFVLDKFGNEYIEIDKDVDYTDTRVLYRAFFNPGHYYFKIENPVDDSSVYHLTSKYKILATYSEKTENDSFSTSSQIFDNEEMNNSLNFYNPDGNFDSKDIYDIYLSDKTNKVKIEYDSNKSGNYMTIYRYEEPDKYKVVEEYTNKAEDYEDDIVLDDGHYYIEVWNKAYKGVTYKLKIDVDW